MMNEERKELIVSLQRYFTEKLDSELGDMEAGALLDFVLTEIGPIAYNQGVEGARQRLAKADEDLPGVCFQETLTYWRAKDGTLMVRRKPDGR